MQEIWKGFLQLLGSMHWSDFLDIAVVAFLIYKILPLFRTSRTMQILKAILFVFAAIWLTSSDVLNMKASHFLLSQVTTVGLLALVVLFQPELRRILDHVGNVKLGKIFSATGHDLDISDVISQTVMACEQLSKEKTGALIVIRQESDLRLIADGGIAIDAKTSVSLLKNIFFKNAPLHDGAVIVEGDRIVAAKCILPVTQSPVPKSYGTRHRAAIGITETSDAVVVVVSEETGGISVAFGGVIERNIAPQNLAQTITKHFIKSEAPKKRKLK